MTKKCGIARSQGATYLKTTISKVVDIVFWTPNRIKEDNELAVDIVIKVSNINVI